MSANAFSGVSCFGIHYHRLRLLHTLHPAQRKRIQNSNLNARWLFIDHHASHPSSAPLPALDLDRPLARRVITRVVRTQVLGLGVLDHHAEQLERAQLSNTAVPAQRHGEHDLGVDLV